jgi:hypothetical protein
MRTFKHSGDLGDLIYALPTLKALGGGSLYLSLNLAADFAEFEKRGFAPDRYPVGPTKCDGTPSGLSPASFAAVVPLLVAQPYIYGVEEWRGQAVNFDLNEWRLQKADFLHESIAALCARRFGLSESVADCSWLDANRNAEEKAPILFARSARYHHPRFPWRKYHRDYGASACFVGLPEEHAAFEAEVGKVRYRPTADLLELARLIAGADLLIANQSLPYAIAEGLKINVVQETSADVPNCMFMRPGAQSGLAWWERTSLWKIQRRLAARLRMAGAAP